MTFNIRNKKYNQMGTIDLEFEHHSYGWIPHTADPDDVEEHTRALYAQALEEGDIAPFVPPTIEHIRYNMPPLTSRQFWVAAASIGVTKDSIIALIDASEEFTLPEKEGLKIEVRETTNFYRLNDLVTDLSFLMGVPAEQLDMLWMWAYEL